MSEIVAQKAGQAGLTQAQSILVDTISRGSSDSEILDVGGYSDSGNLAQALRSEAVQVELKAIRAAKIKGTLAQKALAAMEDLVTNDKTPSATRFSAAKWILEQAGHGAEQDDGKDKPLHEMTESELLAFMARAQKVVDEGGSAPIITVKPRNGA